MSTKSVKPEMRSGVWNELQTMADIPAWTCISKFEGRKDGQSAAKTLRDCKNRSLFYPTGGVCLQPGPGILD